ncbi:MAG: ATP-binding protein, partial [Bacteroidota bacterium]
MVNKQNYAKIFDVYFPLRDYMFDHGPSDHDRSNKNFVGREKVKERLKLFLDKEKSSSNHGAYLIAGYRGMGKTSLVREAIREINEERNKSEGRDAIKYLNFTLSQDDVKDIDLLRQIARELIKYINEEILDNYTRPSLVRRGLKFAGKSILPILIIFLLIVLFGFPKEKTLPLYIFSWPDSESIRYFFYFLT